MAIIRVIRRRRPVPFAQWGTEICDHQLPGDGPVQFAHWKHPSMGPQGICQADVDGLRMYIREGDFAIDVGAHTGDTAVPMALAAGETGRVLALEPNRHVFEILQQNASLNRSRCRIDPRCVAATESDGQYTFHYGDASYCNGGARGPRWWNPLKRKFPLAVEGRNLLVLLEQEYAAWLPRLAFVKVDAEGYDRQILATILPVLVRYRPVVRAEVFKKLGRHERRALWDMLAGAGYEVFRHVGGARPQGRPIARDGMGAERHFDILAIPCSGHLRLAA
jgi:FkbM family methyltransferase